jgi:YfiH family protein
VNGIDAWTAPALSALPWLAHGVTRRAGGVSAPPFDTLNLGLHVGDDPAAVVENRRRLAGRYGFTLDRTVCAEQVHGGAVAVVGPEEAGRGAVAFDAAVSGVDALVTVTPGLLLTLFFADCVPVLLADPVNRAVGVAHGGWRGLDAGVIANTVAAMRDAFGSDPARLVAAVGPCIGPCCFEVGPEVADRFPAEAVAPRAVGGKPHVDLPAVAARLLREAGIAPENVAVAGECTSCLCALYFSHRRDRGQTGRMAAFAGIMPAP